jgi:hypothetical protein
MSSDDDSTQGSQRTSRVRLAGRARGCRAIALDFANGALASADADAVLDLCEELVVGRRLAPKDATPCGARWVHEKGIEPVDLAQATAEEAAPILKAAHARVLAALRGLLRSPQDDRFLNAALYRSQALRLPDGSGGSRWDARVTEAQPLGEWVLALFAADALGDRDAYDRGLAVCSECSFVAFAIEERHDCTLGKVSVAEARRLRRG